MSLEFGKDERSEKGSPTDGSVLRPVDSKGALLCLIIEDPGQLLGRMSPDHT